MAGSHRAADRLALAVTAALICASLAHGVTVICCAGNSVTMTAAYPQALQVLLGSSYTVYNEGVGGASVQSYRTTTGFTDIMSKNPQIITIKLGVNDTHNGGRAQIESYFTTYYDSLINAFLTISPAPQIYLILPAPMFPPVSRSYGPLRRSTTCRSSISTRRSTIVPTIFPAAFMQPRAARRPTR
jgi:lysophospholipase L1-like esterase